MPTVLTINGISQMSEFLKKMPELAIAQSALAMNVGAAKIVADMRQSISQVGEPDGVPRRRTGNLMMSVRAGKQKIGYNTIKQEVGVNPDTEERWGYAGYLEFGTSRMKARPFVKPAFMRNKKNYLDQLKRSLSTQIVFK